MARVKRGVASKKRHKKVLEAGEGLLRQQEPVVPGRQRAGHAVAATTPSATVAPARARSAGCGSSGSTRPAVSTT